MTNFSFPFVTTFIKENTPKLFCFNFFFFFLKRNKKEKCKSCIPVKSSENIFVHYWITPQLTAHQIDFEREIKQNYANLTCSNPTPGFFKGISSSSHFAFTACAASNSVKKYPQKYDFF